MHFLIFIFASIVTLIGTMCFARVLYVLIQPGQMFGSWQGVLRRLSENESQFSRSLAKPLGDCELCFAHFVALCMYPLYIAFEVCIIGWWITYPCTGWLAIIGFNLLWYMFYGSASTWLNLRFILKSASK